MSLFLIWSAAYCDPGLMNEFGRIPEAFVPVGQRRLFQLQSDAALAHGAHVALAIPDDFELDQFDRWILNSLPVQLIRAPAGLAWNHALPLLIEAMGAADRELRLLCGARLLEGIPYAQTDIVSIPGYLSFSSGALFIRSMLDARGDLARALGAYDRSRPLTRVRYQRPSPFGDRDSYLADCRHIIPHRIFNDITVMPDSIVKSSEWKEKVLAEASWYARVPRELSTYLPALIDVGMDADRAWYEVEHIHSLPLSHTFVFGKLPPEAWRSVFLACNDWLAACRAFRPPPSSDVQHFAWQLYTEKALRRLERFTRATGLSLSDEWSLNGQRLPSLAQVVLDATAAIPASARDDICLVHGDLCFSNVLYHPQTRSIRLIDPRGLDAGGEQSIFGDQRYDIAKLHHSVVGLYDFIIAGRYRLSEGPARRLQFDLPDDPQVRAVQALFADMTFNGHTAATAASLPMSILLFLSMLPLHREQPRRQLAFVANALRLYRHFTMVSS